MSIAKYLDELKRIEKNFIYYLDYETNIEENYQNIISIFDDINIYDNRYKIKLLLYLISKISKNHHRGSGFFSKIERILQLFKNDIQKYFSNSELFHIFKSNKRLLLYLIEEKLLIIDEFIVNLFFSNEKYIKAKYLQYFQPEIKPLINKEWLPQNVELINEIKKELPDNFYEKRKIGENDDEICELIQKDLIEEFIIYVNKNYYPIQSKIHPSIYETNNFLLKQENLTLIEYAVFFGSIQIFNYLRQNGAELNSSLWIFAVHGQDEEIIHFLEENEILPSDDEILPSINEKVTFDQIFKESIKCHHFDVANYIQNNYLQNVKGTSKDALNCCFNYCNFMIMNCNADNETLFYYSCTYDYYLFAFNLLENTDLDINKKKISILIVFDSISN